MEKLPIAIICAPTEAEAQKLFAFIQEYAPDYCKPYRDGTNWEWHTVDTCYSVEPLCLCFGDRKWYEGPENQVWMNVCGAWPDDPCYQFCSVDEYIALVTGVYPGDLSEESDLQFGSDLADLL